MDRVRIKELLAVMDEIAEPAGLIEYAASEAAKQLADNWLDALEDGYSPSIIDTDTEAVVNLLRSWSQRVKKELDNGQEVHEVHL